jgi:hypothetical protein
MNEQLHRSLFIIIAILIPVTSIINEAQARQEEQKAGPQAVFVETIHDAGTVEAGTDLTHTFKIKNVGKADLLIEQVKPTCGCILTEFTEIIPPGQEGQVILSTKTPILRSTVQATAWIYTNDPAHKAVLLGVKAITHPLIEVLPAPSLSMQVKKGEAAVGTLTLVNRDTSPLKIEALELNNKEYSAQLKTLEKGQRYEIVVKLGPKDTDGPVAGLLTIVTNKEKLPKIPIAVVTTVTTQANPTDGSDSTKPSGLTLSGQTSTLITARSGECDFVLL